MPTPPTPTDRAWQVVTADGHSRIVNGKRTVIAHGGVLLVLDHRERPRHAFGAWVEAHEITPSGSSDSSPHAAVGRGR